ncbi:hypothetical protein [Rubinisphaera italica]|uniref:hypothetical protein n=1 Tax=Rubinisphaera italica TaxID=2527969 RepID=UPI0013EF571C|nr:hypothetical protein [Rubinisphaera italica]
MSKTNNGIARTDCSIREQGHLKLKGDERFMTSPSYLWHQIEMLVQAGLNGPVGLTRSIDQDRLIQG